MMIRFFGIDYCNFAMMGRIILIGIVFLLPGCANTSANSKNTMSDIIAMQTVYYIEDSLANIDNPHRGFYDAEYSLDANRTYNPFLIARNNGYRLLYAPINLTQYVNTPVLPSVLLQTIQSNLNDANQSGMHLILRIRYRLSLGGTDPSLNTILGHLNQLSPLLKQYRNLFSAIQAGCIGAWGEWHSFTGDFNQATPSYRSNRKAIISKLREIFPQKFIQLRTPMHKELLYGSSQFYADIGNLGQILPTMAYGSDIRAVIGFHDDCVLYDDTDRGTYATNDVTFWKTYVQNDAQYTLLGGELCGIKSPAFNALSDCSNAIQTLRSMHFSYLNDATQTGILNKWKTQGCYQYIKENLGYRFVAKELNITKRTSETDVSLSIVNKGFASAYHNIPVSWILKNQSHTYRIPLSIDIRHIQSGNFTTLVGRFVHQTTAKGNYCLYLQIGQNSDAVRLSNRQIWDTQLQSNRLTCSIHIP